MRLSKLIDSGDEMAFISPEWTHSDWPIRFIVRVEYPENWGDDAEKTVGRYHVSISAVSVAACSPEALSGAWQSTGVDPADMSSEWQHYELMSYGIHAPLWQSSGNNLRALLRAARKELATIDMFFGFYMDRPVSAIGSTGWDWIRGDILAGLKA